MIHDHAKEVAAARDATLRPSDAAAAKLAGQNKLYVRERLALLFDEGTFVEDAQLANALAGNLPADGVITAGELVDYVRANVPEETEGEQHPSYSEQGFDMNLPLAHARRDRASKN